LGLWGVWYAARAGWRANRMASMEGRLTAVEAELDKLRAELQAERVARIEADRRRSEAEIALGALRVDLAGVRAHNEGLIREAAERGGQILELERTVAELKAQVNSRDSRIVELEREIERRKQADARRHAS